MQQATVIIGTGMAGYSVARELRKLDQQVPLILVTADSGDFYSKPMLSNALAQSKTTESLVTTKNQKMAEQLDATIHGYTQLVSIDTQAQMLELENLKTGIRTQLAYSQLVLALGAAQRQISLDGNAVDDVISINSLEDYARFETLLRQSKHVTIIGSGLIGCEFANDLVSAGYDTVVVGASATPLANLIPEQVGQFFAQKLNEQGVQWKNNNKVQVINKSQNQYELVLSDNSCVATDLVVSAIGLQPCIKIAESAGLQTNKGIVVDLELKTSAKNIYAIGDCAEINGQVLAFILPIMHSARALAKTLCGQATSVKFPVMPVMVKTPAHSVVAVPPPRDINGKWSIELKPNGVCALYHDAQQQLQGYALSGSEVANKQQLNKELSKVITG